MKKTWSNVTLSILTICLLTTSAFAIEATPNSVEVNFGIGAAVILDVGASLVDFGNVNPDGSPYTRSSATSLGVKANTANGWTLQIRANGDLVSALNPALTIPLSQLRWKGGNVSVFTACTTSPQTVKTGLAGTDTVPIDYQFSVNYYNPAQDQYQTSITYTLAGN